MPSRAKRPCAKPGCAGLVQPPERYCPQHAHLARERQREADRYYDTHQRDQQAREFYRSPEWEAVRKAVLVRDHWLCRECLRNGRITAADTVHHREELRKAWHRRLDMSNLESVCRSCHRDIHSDGG